MTNRLKLLFIIGAILSFVGFAQAQANNNQAVFSDLPPSVQAKLLASVTNPPAAAAPTNTVTMPPGGINGGIGIIVSNLPTTGLSQETVGVGLGTLMRNDNTFSAVTLLDWNVKTNFYIRAELEEATTGNIIEGAGIGGGYVKTTSAARMYSITEIRRDFANTPLSTKASWDGILGAGIAYAPTTNSLANFSVFAEQRMVIPINLSGGQNTSPRSETVGGIRYSF